MAVMREPAGELRKGDRLRRPKRSGPQSRFQPVADAAHGHQIARPELVPQAMHMFGHRGLALPAPRAGPDLLEKLRTGEHVSRVRGEEGEQVELAGGERHRLPVDLDLAGPGIYAQLRAR